MIFYKNGVPFSIGKIDAIPLHEELIPIDGAPKYINLKEFTADLDDNFWKMFRAIISQKKQERMNNLSNKLWIYHQNKKVERMLFKLYFLGELYE